MSSNSSKSREEILAERLEKKKRKAALKNQNKDKSVNVIKETIESSAVKKKESDTQISSPIKEVKNQKGGDLTQTINETITSLVECPNSIGDSREKKQEKTDENNVQQKLCSDIPEGCKQNANISEKEIIKTKAQLKAERRAKQEADRARKQEKTQGVPQEKKSLKAPVKVAEPSAAPTGKKELPNVGHKVKLFAHLYNIESDRDVVDASMEKVHPSITQLGAQYSSKVVSGANACCLALLNALKKVVLDFETPANQEFSRGLEAEISKSMANLSKYRPVAVSMVNAVKHLKYQVSQCKKNELECKNNLSEWIDTYIKEQLEMAAKAICLFVREKIAPGDVILTYGCSSLIQQILISVHNEGINFQVIVADGRPWLEGREMLKKLVSAGIHCTYVFVNGLSFIMPEVTKILLGAHALLANGYVMSRAGSSQIALLAKTYNVPVLVCCETHKFSERVQTDSFVYNELGNPDELASKKGCLSQELTKWKSIQFLTPLNLTYDITPPDLVSAVVTEIAVLPCTSVPVILRIKPPDVSC